MSRIILAPMEGLAEIGTLCAGTGMLDAIVVALPAAGVDDVRWVRAVRSHPDTKYGRVVVLGGETQSAWKMVGGNFARAKMVKVDDWR